ncbi:MULTISPECIES: undecaprenyl-diphosphatase [Brevibacillus]|uniref:Undecaprenyl-diphosphatase n=1 Tax=Brevibacillus parabrevis TaxID=54914 RepID=A0A4Y3PLA4_BREPA|nr:MULTISPECIES: undecaprenyl-diphosphatase [Brevibacillus]MBU8714130.1 undecaprenyl-diphosphatase [Brevibacillus parabrevis]MDH6350419.1 undecaprenyl-diphosphatase [Brevibacillus sp. 1238]MDR4998528.1 undecaprenyl-diphosphatase [Brevibacillus parabrevis]MED2258410.1 undecaprenyl-diphosphatase [Brevibacillus parabrevis]NRQ55716.1 undecaprenyl-diphosphatase [Brevibacillus sp. HD1.4A]
MNLMELNVQCFRAINDLGKQYPELNPAFYAIAEYTVYALALCALLYWFTRDSQNRMMVICATATFVMAEVLGKLAGTLHTNNQPFAELANVNQLVQKAVDNSFPSDHTILFFSFCVSFWLFQRKTGILWMLLAVCVGLSRIWVGVHYPADVLVGALISIGSALTVFLLLPRFAFVHSLLSFYEKMESAILPVKPRSKGL